MGPSKNELSSAGSEADDRDHGLGAEYRAEMRLIRLLVTKNRTHVKLEAVTYRLMALQKRNAGAQHRYRGLINHPAISSKRQKLSRLHPVHSTII